MTPFLRNLVLSLARQEKWPVLIEVRQQLLDQVMAPVVGLGFVAGLLGAIQSYLQGRWFFSLVYISLFVLLFWAMALRRRLPLLLRQFILLGILYAFSLAVLLRVGLSGVGVPILLVFTVFSAVLAGLRAGLIALATGCLTMAVIGSGMVTGWLPIYPEQMLTSRSALAWVTSLVVFWAGAIGLVLVSHGLLVRLRDSSALLEKHSVKLGRVNAVLKRQVKNRRRAENALRESEEQLRLVYDTIPDAVTLVRADNDRFVDVNNGFYRLSGYRRQDVIGKTVEELNLWCRPEDRRNMSDIIKREGRADNIETGFRLKDGAIFTGLISATSLTLRGQRHILAITRDVSERQRAQQALKDSEEKYRFVVDNASEGILLIQGQRILFMNRHAMEQTGYIPEERPGLLMHDLLHPQDRDEVLGRYQRIMSGEALKGQFEYRIIDKTGAPKWVRSHSIRVDWAGEPAMLVFATEITRQKEMAAEKQRLEERLQRARKMESLGTLAGGVAHDLNNVLSGIVSYPDLLLLELAQDSPLRKPVITMRESGKRAAAIVQDLLTLARRAVVTMETVSLNRIIDNYLQSPEHAMLLEFHPRVRVQTRLAADLLSVRGSPLHLQKTVMNLVSNATEAMGEGGVVTLATENRHIGAAAGDEDPLRPGDYVVLSVADTGIGISPEEKERIFEPFYTKKVMGRSGTGLGMSVVWGTVQDHRGHIDVHSLRGKGTTFVLYLPATRQAVDHGDAKPLSPVFDLGKGEKILVVDDMEDQREIAAALLESLGYAVDTVAGGQEAIAYLANQSVDLVVLDMIMGTGMDGLETYRRMAGLRPGQKAIIASGYSETDRVKEARRLGVGAYLRKPYTLEAIGKAVRSELDRPAGQTPALPLPSAG